MRAFFRDIRRRKIDRDPLGGQRNRHGRERRAHPFPRLRDRFVRQPHNREARQTGGDGALHLDAARDEALESHGMGLGKTVGAGGIKHTPPLRSFG